MGYEVLLQRIKFQRRWFSKDDKEIVQMDKNKWFQEDQNVMLIIQNSFETFEVYSYCETAKDIWEFLQ